MAPRPSSSMPMPATEQAAVTAPSHATDEPIPKRPPLAVGLVAAFAGVKLCTHLLAIAITPYEVHRDEFLYMAMGKYLDFWRMDVPPAISVLAKATTALFGNTLFAVRLVPALFGTALVVLAALLARELGGRRFAQGLAALAVLANPLFLRTGTLFQPVVLDQVWWTLSLFALVRLVHTGDRRWWIGLGVIAGLGLLTKLSILFFGFAVALALLLTPLRRAYLTPWPYAALLTALLVGSATFVGQVRLGWPVFGQMEALQAVQLERVTPLDFIGTQLLFGPATLLGWLGAAALLFDRRLQPFRVVGWTGLIAFLILLLVQGKGYYFGPMYPVLGAAGAVWLERRPGVRLAPLAKRVAVVLLILYGVITLPLGLPVLPPPLMARYAATLGVTQALQTNTGTYLPLPQDYADMLGWKEMVQGVADAYQALPTEQRQEVVVAGENYGEAGALDFYGPRYGLPRAISTHTSYWFFGPGNKPGTVLLALGVPRASLEMFYERIELVGRYTNPWAVEEEQNVPIYKAAGPRRTLQEIWPFQRGRY